MLGVKSAVRLQKVSEVEDKICGSFGPGSIGKDPNPGVEGSIKPLLTDSVEHPINRARYFKAHRFEQSCLQHKTFNISRTEKIR